jgi:hypothetical protein
LQNGAFLYRYWLIKDSSFKDFRLPSIALRVTFGKEPWPPRPRSGQKMKGRFLPKIREAGRQSTPPLKRQFARSVPALQAKYCNWYQSQIISSVL